jgi:hypothetical protein
MSTNSQNFIGILKTEYNRRVGRKLESSQSSVTPQVNQTRAYKRPSDLLSRISQPQRANSSTSTPSVFCKLCQRPAGHYTNDCPHFTKRCTNCNIIGHEESECRFEKINKKYKSGKVFNSRCGGKRRRFGKENAHQSEETAHIEEEVVFQTTELNDESLIDGEEYYNFDTDVVDYKNDEHLIYYNCLANTATTSYVLNH